MNTSTLPVMKRMCASCPFRKRGLTEVRPLLEERALSEASPICHSTGESDITPRDKKVHLDSWICRGARDYQIQYFYAIRFIEAPTDEAWQKKWDEMQRGVRPTRQQAITAIKESIGA